jgi:hypothetical protein
MSLSPASEESLGQRWRRPRRFRLCARKHRFSVRRLQAKLLRFLGLVGTHARRLGRKLSTPSTRGGSPCPRSASTRALVVVGQKRYSKGGQAAAEKEAPRRGPSVMRTKSFYAQAIAECLEFIKQNSIPLQDYGSPVLAIGAIRR